MRKKRHRRGIRHRNHRPRLGWHQGTEHATAALVVGIVHRLHRLGHRLLDRDAGLAAPAQLYPWRAQSFPARRGHGECARASGGARRQGTRLHQCQPRANSGQSRSAAIRAGRRQGGVRRQLRRLPRRRRHKARAAIPISTTMCGCGAGRLTTSSTPSPSACAQPARTRASRRCPPSAATAY